MGSCLTKHERHEYEDLVTTDQSMRYQQNMSQTGLGDCGVDAGVVALGPTMYR